MSLETLADRIEGLTGPDREVDAEIVVALDIRPAWCVGYGRGIYVAKEASGEIVVRINTTGKKSMGHPNIGDFPHFTASLDAAMTLMPAGFDFMLDNFDGARAGFRCSAGVFVSGDWCDCKGATTPALALCAAALRARSAVAKGAPTHD